MKISIKGFRKLFKAIGNRAHLFPVKVPIQGKNKSYYGIRWKSGTKAMEYIKKDIKVSKDSNLLFDSKDGKKKGMTENQVLSLYEKTGKNGSLQDFIKANFKKPRAEDEGQLSFGNMGASDSNKGADSSKSEEKSSKKDNEVEKPQQKKSDKNNDDKGAKPTKNELEAVEYYVSGDGMYINDYLRNRNNPVDRMGPMSSLDKDLIKYLENATNREHSCKTLYRTVDASAIFGDINDTEWDNLKGKLLYNGDHDVSYLLEKAKGKVVIDKGFMSTTKDYDKALDFEDFTGAEHPVIMTLSNANKVKGFDVGKYLPELNKRMDQEEVILHNNSKYVIKDIIGKDGKIQVIGEFVQENQKTPEQKDKELKEKRTKQRIREAETANNLESLTGDELRKVKKFGTKKIESTGEYPKAKNLNDFVSRTKAMKDFHLDIKGRAMLDMFGINAPLFNKRNGKPISINPHLKALGYCRRDIYGKTTEIALVCESGNSVGETKTTVHECMHSKLKNSVHEVFDDITLKKPSRKKTICHDIEETMVEMAGQGVSNMIHGNDTDKQLWSYDTIVAQVAPMIWGTPEFKEARKGGLHGIGQEICRRLMNDDTSFVQNVVDEYLEAPIDNIMNGKMEDRYKAIETKIFERTDKVEKIQQDTGESSIANLVEELKHGTISLEGALNSSKYREIAAVLITKFLEDEDIEALEQLALSF